MQKKVLLFMFENFGFGGLLEHAMMKSMLSQRQNTPPSESNSLEKNVLLGTAGFYFLPPETTISGKKHVHLLKRKLELHMIVCSNQIFMLDGTLCHRSKWGKNS